MKKSTTIEETPALPSGEPDGPEKLELDTSTAELTEITELEEQGETPTSPGSSVYDGWETLDMNSLPPHVLAHLKPLEAATSYYDESLPNNQIKSDLGHALAEVRKAVAFCYLYVSPERRAEDKAAQDKQDALESPKTTSVSGMELLGTLEDDPEMGLS